MRRTTTLVTSCEEFYRRAADALPEDVLNSAAAYTQARQGTDEVLATLNPILGTSHSLPPWGFMSRRAPSPLR